MNGKCQQVYTFNKFDFGFAKYMESKAPMTKVLIFKTNIETINEVNLIEPVLVNHPVINKWSIDTEDIDNVLRIEASENLNESEIISLINAKGFFCEDLTE